MRRRFLAALLTSAPMAALGLRAFAARPESCPAARFGGTILQLLRDNAASAPEDWQRLLEELRSFGLGELVLQWTSIDNTDFYGGHAGAGEVIPLLPEIVRAAGAAGVRLWVGLQQDSGFWPVLERPTPELAAYLRKRTVDLQERLPPLSAAIASARPGVIAGWYLTEEIDDRNWRDPEREAILGRYLAETRALLNRARPGLPVAMSVFVSEAGRAREFGMQLRRLVRLSRMDRVLLQDGTGAGGRAPAEAAVTARTIARSLASGRSGPQLGMIVELFNMRQNASAQTAATEPASVQEILERLAATAGIGTLPPMSFSHVHHLTAFGGSEAAQRGVQWRQLLANCR